MTDETPEIRLTQDYTHPPATVWKFLTVPEFHARWFVPGDIQPIVGHAFSLDMGKWGQQACEVFVAEPERCFGYRFAIGRLDTTITWTLTPLPDGGTRLELVHAGFDLDNPISRMALEGMRPGWPGIMRRLGEVAGEAVTA